MKLFKGKKGFTLIELVVVIAILGILGGMAIPRFLDATQSARGSRIIADLRTIDSAVVIYSAKVGRLPSSSAKITADADASSTDPSYKLLAAWPEPPTGIAKFPKGGTKAGGGNYEYSPDNNDGLATFDGSTAADLSKF